MSRKLGIGVLIAALTGCVTSDAMAQRGADFKVRRMYGNGVIARPGVRDGMNGAYSYRPNYGYNETDQRFSYQPTDPTYDGDQRYSYEPGQGGCCGQNSNRYGQRDGQNARRYSFEAMPIRPGDQVVVLDSNVRIMKGDRTVGQATRGLTFDATQVRDGWVGADVDVNGEHLNGWIWFEHLGMADEARLNRNRRAQETPAPQADEPQADRQNANDSQLDAQGSVEAEAEIQNQPRRGDNSELDAETNSQLDTQAPSAPEAP